MRRVRLYCPTLSEGCVLLDPQESHHAIVSLRLKPGRSVILFDGVGQEARAHITQIRHRRVCVQVDGITQRSFEFAWRVTLAVAMCKSHRQGYLIEKCTELGVDAIWPIISRRSVCKPDRGSSDKWSRRAIEAAKQSHRAWVPTIPPPLPFADCLKRVSNFDAVALADGSASWEQRAIDHSWSESASVQCAKEREQQPSHAAATPFTAFLSSCPPSGSILVFVGPEGGFTEEERDSALQVGVVATTLCHTILRTETAAVAICAAVALAR